jgi:hypothetical protein
MRAPHKSTLKCFCFLFIIFIPVVVNSATINVPSALAPTIQAGINLAVKGDTVLVANGIYKGPGNSDLDFKGKAITVQSTGGAANCTIDASQGVRGLWFHHQETAASVFSGFTITNGNAGIGDGGGVLCELSSSPTIRNCTISGNKGTLGGGIGCSNSSPQILNCRVEGNMASASGGGISCDLAASPMILSCRIDSNNSVLEGGGVSIDNQSSPIIFGSRFDFNGSVSSGGGLFIGLNSSPKITTCKIISNSSKVSGGGIAASFNSAPTILNSLIASNNSNVSGGGIDSYSASPIITNCTIDSNNSAAGGAIHSRFSSDRLTNSILTANYPNEIHTVSSGINVSYSDIRGGHTGIGNISADPKYVDRRAGDYRLGVGSPCINAGTNKAPGIMPARDLAGNPRIIAQTIDMGAYEF